MADRSAGRQADQLIAAFARKASHAAALRALLEGHGFTVIREYSFPFVRTMGRLFRYNEFVAIGQREGGSPA